MNTNGVFERSLRSVDFIFVDSWAIVAGDFRNYPRDIFRAITRDHRDAWHFFDRSVSARSQDRDRACPHARGKEGLVGYRDGQRVSFIAMIFCDRYDSLSRMCFREAENVTESSR